MGATLAGGDGAVLSHESAAALWGIHPTGRRRDTAGVDPIHVTIPASRRVRIDGIESHRRKRMPPATTKGPIPLTQPLFTLVDLASMLGDRQLESAVNEADKLGLLEAASADALAAMPRTKGIGRLERILGAHTPTDSDLERDFLRLIRRAGLPEPKTQQRVSGHRVDFYWPEHRLVVEVDGSAYHRTPTQLTRDRERDHAHARAGLTPLRFTDIQINGAPDEVIATLEALGVRRDPRVGRRGVRRDPPIEPR